MLSPSEGKRLYLGSHMIVWSVEHSYPDESLAYSFSFGFGPYFVLNILVLFASKNHSHITHIRKWKHFFLSDHMLYVLLYSVIRRSFTFLNNLKLSYKMGLDFYDCLRMSK